MLKDVRQARQILRAVIDASDRPVTVKLRMGFDGDDRSDCLTIADDARAAGAAGVCVHARTVEQRYTGRADWDFLTEVKRRYPQWTVIASGDAATPTAAAELMAVTGADGVAIARGAIGNPWFFRQLADHLAGREPRRPDLAEQRAVLEDHFDQTVAMYGPRRGPARMRKFGIKYARMHPTPAKVRAAFVNVKSPAGWRRALDEFYPSGNKTPDGNT